jgi:hypothetical protein
MADLTTRMELVPWPSGTTVGAYLRKSDLRLPDGPPPGVPVSGSAVVATDQSLTFTLPEGSYWAIAPLTAGLRDYLYLSFVLAPPSAPSGGNAQVLIWDDNASAYVPSGARDFRGPVDPTTLPGADMKYGDVWTPTQEPTA